MKLMFLLTFLCTLQVFAKSEAQTTVTFTVKNAELQHVFSIIESKTSYRFIFNDDLIPESRVNLKVENQPVTQVLDLLFRGLSLSYKISDNNLILVGGSKDPPTDRLLTGVVKDVNGEPLANVSIVIKGTKVGTTTGPDGKFTLQVTDAAVLVFSYVGFGEQEVPVNGKTELDVVLHPLKADIDSVVVIGYSTQKRRDVTASVGSVSGTDIKDLPATNVEEALQGRIAGVQVIKASGAPGASADIIIRGLSSLNAPAPLYVIDGVRSSGENFNTQDIASIDVIKDASAAAIYGSAAAGGVILITTKKGAKGKPVVNFSARYGSTKPLVQQLLGRDDFVKLRREYDSTYLAGVDVSTLPNTNWTKALYSNGTEENYDLSVSGATDNTNYLVSLFYNGQKGVYIDNSSYLSGARVNTEFRLTKDVKIGEQLYLSQQNINPTNANPPPNPAYRSVPIMSIYDSTNVTGGGWGKSNYGFEGTNYVGNELTMVAQTRSFNMQGNVYAEVKLPLYLTFRSTFSYSPSFSNSNTFRETYNFGTLASTTNSLTKYSSNGKSVLYNYVLSFAHNFGKHYIDALAGYEQIAGTSDYTQITQTAQAIQPSYTFFPTASSAYQNLSGAYDPNSLIKSTFGRVNYNYDGKYYLSGTIRRDGNFTTFGPGNEYGVFPSVSGGWRISNEPFFKGLWGIVNQLKLRGSYGVLGNSNIPSYYFLSTYQLLNAQNFSPGDGSTRNLGYGLTSLANRDIKWESLYETNIGVDAELFHSKLFFTMEWYNKATKNMLYNVPIPESSGITSSFLTNIGSVNNKGLEVAVGYRDHVGQIGYSVNVNAGFNKNKVLNLDGVTSNPIRDGNTGYGPMTGYSISITEPGQSFADFYGYKVLGIFKTDAEAAASAQPNAHAGDLIFAHNAKNGATLTNADMQIIGNPNPKMVYGININLNWKGIDIAALFNGVAGVDIFNGLKPDNQFLYSDGNATAAAFGASFLGSNGLTGQPRAGVAQPGGTILADPNGNYSTPSSYFVESGSYMKLKNLQIGYTFSGGMLANAHIASARLFVMGNNLLTITKYSGLDPELSGSVTARGIDLPNQYPHTRIYSCGLNVSF